MTCYFLRALLYKLSTRYFLKYSHVFLEFYHRTLDVQCNFNFYTPPKLNWYTLCFTNLRYDPRACSGYTIACFPRLWSYRLYMFTLQKSPSTIQFLDFIFLNLGRVFLQIPSCQELELRWNTQIHALKPCPKNTLILRTHHNTRSGS